MPSGLSFNVFRIPVRIEPSFFMIALFFGLGADSFVLILSWVVIVTLSVLAHELGHAVTFRIFDRQPNVILQWMGGVTFAPGGLSPARHLLVSLSGPLTGLLLIGVPALLIAQGVPDDGSTWGFVVAQVVWVNILWSLFNLAPVLPLDGGNVTASVLHFVVGSRAMGIAHIISIVVALAGGLFAWLRGPQYIFVMLFAGFLAYWNFSQLKTARPREDQLDLTDGYRAISRGDPADAVRLADGVIQAHLAEPVLGAAVELKAWANVCSGDPVGARSVLNGLPAGITPNHFLIGSIALLTGRRDDALTSFASGLRAVQFGPWSPIAAGLIAKASLVDELLARMETDGGVDVGPLVQLQAHLHYAGFYRDAARTGERAFAARPGDQGQVAYNIACDWALAGETETAMAWLERTVALGFATRQQIDDDPDLSSLRGDSRYSALMARLPAT